MTKESTECAPLPVVNMMGLPFAQLSEAQCNQAITDSVKQNQGGWLITVNLDYLARMHRDTAFRAQCEQATMYVADGMPIIWASKLLKQRLPERIAGSKLISSLSETLGKEGKSIYLLGGDTGTAAAAASELKSKSPGFRIAGHSSPWLTGDIAQDEAALKKIVDELVFTRPSVVFVALGSPKQEYLITTLRQRMCGHADIGGLWWIGVGISFSFLSGQVKQAPAWVSNMGFEWLHRLLQEPKRLAKRYLLDDPPALVRLFAHVLRRRFGT